MLQKLNLWTLHFSNDRLHHHFKCLAATPTNRECIDRWTDGFDDVNGNFVDEFQTKFSPAFWELYLHAMFKSLGFTVSRPADRPDFLLTTTQGDIVAEARVAEAGEGQTPEWAPKEQTPYDRDQFYSQTTERLANAVWSKIKAYQNYAKLPHVKGRPFLLCVGPYDHPWFVLQHARAIWRVLYRYDQPIVEITSSGKMREIGHRPFESITKNNGQIVPLGYFLDSENADISAVFFSPRATLGKIFSDPHRIAHGSERVLATWYMVSTDTLVSQNIHPSQYRETLADGGYLLLNPYATRPIDPEPFFRQGVTVCTFDPQNGQLTSRTPEPFLFERVTIGVVPDEFPPELMNHWRNGM